MGIRGNDEDITVDSCEIFRENVALLTMNWIYK